MSNHAVKRITTFEDGSTQTLVRKDTADGRGHWIDEETGEARPSRATRENFDKAASETDGEPESTDSEPESDSGGD